MKKINQEHLILYSIYLLVLVIVIFILRIGVYGTGLDGIFLLMIIGSFILATYALFSENL